MFAANLVKYHKIGTCVMTAYIKNGDLLKVKSGVIVHGCNAQGVMGSGVALQIKNKWPTVFRSYRNRFESSQMKVGSTDIVFIKTEPTLAVVNAVTQEFYGREPGVVYIDYDSIKPIFEDALQTVKMFSSKDNMIPIHYPRIGGGLGGGDFTKIYATICETLGDWDHILWLPEGESFIP